MIKHLGKLNLSSVFLLAACTLGFSNPPSLAKTRPLLPPIPSEPPARSAPEKFDYSLLIRAMKQFLASDRYLLESELTLSAQSPGITMASVARIQTIAEEPNKFRTKISFANPEGESVKEYLLISNGEQVWTLNLAKNVYTVVDYLQFQQAKDNFMSGMISRLFSTIRNSAGPDNISLLINIPETQLIKILETQLASKVEGLTTDIQNLDGTNYTTYSYQDQTKGYKMRVFIDTPTSEIRHFQLSSHSDKQLDFMINEKVIRSTVPPSVPADTFRFLPPLGSKLQNTPISINPFL